jgi:hypothetical protein
MTTSEASQFFPKAGGFLNSGLLLLGATLVAGAFLMVWAILLWLGTRGEPPVSPARENINPADVSVRGI